MKKLLSYSLLAAAAAAGVSLADTATTAPVGYITASVGANASNGPRGAATFVSPPLVKSAEFTGAATSSPSGVKTINFSGNVPTGLNSTYVLEIAEGAQEGWWTAVASSTATQITVADDFPAGLSSTVKVTVRKFTTVQDVFGANNSANLAPYSSSSPYDEIQVLNPINQSTSAIIFAGGAWTDSVTEDPAGSVIIYPGTSVKVIHRSNTTLSVVMSGEVKTTKTQVDVYPNVNWIAQPNPTGGTFGSMQLGAQLAPTDFVNVINPDTGSGQSTDAFVAVGGNMYNYVTEDPANTQPVAEGKGYLIKRASGTPASIVTIPAQVVAP